jgi:hypothetical protein
MPTRHQSPHFRINIIQKKYTSFIDISPYRRKNVTFDKFRGANVPGILCELHIRTRNKLKKVASFPASHYKQPHSQNARPTTACDFFSAQRPLPSPAQQPPYSLAVCPDAASQSRHPIELSLSLPLHYDSLPNVFLCR